MFEILLFFPILVDVFVRFICFRLKKSRQFYLFFNLILQAIIFSNFFYLGYTNTHGFEWYFFSLFTFEIIISSSIINFFWIQDKTWRLTRLLFVFIFLTSYYTYNFYIIQILALAYFILTVIDFRQLGNGKKELVEKAIDNEES